MAEILEPKLGFGGRTQFCKRMSILSDQHDPVAERVVDQFVQEGHSAFISDGVTAFGVGLYLFARKRRVLIHTNNLALSLESCMWQDTTGPHDFQVVTPSGSVDERLCMIYGREANAFAEQSAAELEWTVLSVSAFFGDRGPAGQEYNSLQIKRAAVIGPRRVIWLADANKLSQDYHAQPLVYVNEQEWQAAARRGNVWVVTSKPNGEIPTIKDPEILGPALIKELKDKTNGVYAVNRARLQKLLGDRFVEVDSPKQVK